MDLQFHTIASTNFLVTLLLITGLKASYCLIIDYSQTSDSINATPPEVRIPHGEVRGIHMVTHHGRKVFGFKGIPFAKPPLGNLRFRAPVPAEPWNGTLDASKESNPCTHFLGSTVHGNEDCLYLTVYTPKLPRSANTTLLPVMVYIFGGGFSSGSITSSRYGPYFLLDKDIVLVLPTFRLSVLGFLSTGDDVCPGNNGLKDVVQALKWCQDNIRYFGGDPNQVTLAGGSSGAMTIDLLTLSDLTTGLFHRIIMQSGSALCPDVQRSKNTFPIRATQLGEHFGCSTNTSLVLVECLRGIDASELVRAREIFNVWQDVPINIWGPTVEPDVEGALLTDTPANLLSAGKGHDLPRLSLFTLEEGVYYHSLFYNRPELFQDFLKKFDVIIPAILAYDILYKNASAYTAMLESYYLNVLTANTNLLLNNITQLVSDGLFNYPLHRSLQFHLRHKKSPQYLCSFEYRGQLSYSQALTKTRVDWGSVHGDETVYLFQRSNGYGFPDLEMDETDWKMVDLMVQLWVSFATNGKLTSTNSNGTTIFESYSLRKSHIRIGFNSEVSLGVGYNFFEERAKFWDELTANTTWK